MRPRRPTPPRLPHSLRPGLQALYDLPDIPPRPRMPAASLFWRGAVVAVVLAALLVLPIRAAWAATADDDSAPARGSRWGLGMAALTVHKPYRGVEPDLIALPLLVYESKWWSVYGPSLSLNLPSLGPVALSLTTRLSHDGYDASDSPSLDGMQQRKDRLWLGGSGTWRTGIANTTLEWMHDVSGYSRGQRVGLSVEHVFDRGLFELIPRLGAAWLDRRYVDYYYGVRPQEARAQRLPYRPGASINVEAGLRAACRVAHRDSLFLDVGVDRFGAQIRDSPLVDSALQSRIVLGYVHVF
ncbi:outer membrane protein [Xanthomonas sp. JAI131]|uniref:MipA/OmpV family protein n=1 Tax=Xanthomonas sp. JAI131 TaxID=2723067 RepID=UPI0015CE4388|nr:MipA/OmpV family protein [Xanthomonas sp. JAI131]NYF20133.1 outer membrane protein [Xanthomonas sp. JAI131]